MTTKTTQPIQEIYNATRTGIEELRAVATEVLKQGFHGIAEAARRDDAQDVRLKLKRRNVWRTSSTPPPGSRTISSACSSKSRRTTNRTPSWRATFHNGIREAEIRLELLREINRQ